MSFGAQRPHQKYPAQQFITIDLSHSTGVALAFNRHIQLLGITPGAREIQGIVDWLRSSHIDPILYTTQLGRYHLPALQFADKASGVLAVRIDQGRAGYLLFFKPPMEHSMRMVRRSEGDRGGRISASRMVNAGPISQPWTQSEIATAMKLKKELQELQRARVQGLLIRADP